MDLGDGVSGSKNEPLTPSPRSKIFLFKEARIPCVSNLHPDVTNVYLLYRRHNICNTTDILDERKFFVNTIGYVHETIFICLGLIASRCRTVF